MERDAATAVIKQNMKIGFYLVKIFKRELPVRLLHFNFTVLCSFILTNYYSILKSTKLFFLTLIQRNSLKIELLLPVRRNYLVSASKFIILERTTNKDFPQMFAVKLHLLSKHLNLIFCPKSGWRNKIPEEVKLSTRTSTKTEIQRGGKGVSKYDKRANELM